MRLEGGGRRARILLVDDNRPLVENLTEILEEAGYLVHSAGSCAGALGQVVVNVLKNALDAVEGREGAKVRVLADCDMGEVKVRVEDNGPGIGKEGLKGWVMGLFFVWVGWDYGRASV